MTRLSNSQDHEVYIAKRKDAQKVLTQVHGDEHPKIEQGIPVPIENRGGARQFGHFYPFEDMKIGDSFWVGGDTKCTNGAVTDFAKKSGWKFVTRGQSKDGKSNATITKTKAGVRVWRTG